QHLEAGYGPPFNLLRRSAIRESIVDARRIFVKNWRWRIKRCLTFSTSLTEGKSEFSPAGSTIESEGIKTMKLLRRLFVIISILSMFVFMTATGMLAQKGTSIVTRINFARGRTTAVEKGSVHRGMSHDYLLKSGAGQTMS